MLDAAFEGTAWHSLLGNLKPVTPEDWLWVPHGGKRSIHDIVQHVGSSKRMYENHAFGDRKLTWGTVPSTAVMRSRTFLRRLHG